MSDGSLLAALLASAYGLALLRADRGTIGPALLVFLAAAAAMAMVARPWAPLPPFAQAGGFAGAALLALVALLPLPRDLAAVVRGARTPALLVGGATGALAGTLLAGSAGGSAWASLMPVLVAAPGLPTMATGRLVTRVAASWVLAVAVLGGTLALAPVTAGNAPDHFE